MLRLFIAIPTPQPVLPLLANTRDTLRDSRADVKWEPTDKLHCTVKFLGDTKEDLVQNIVSSLTQIGSATPPFNIRYTGLGCFPNRRDPRIIWAGIADSSEQLKRLFGEIDDAMTRLGFEREQRAFHPHVTLGRVKGSRRISELLDTMETLNFDHPPVMIKEIELVKSTLKPGGSEYSPVARVELAGRGEIRV
jgi:RNA 2',3'-cyclic 3'-phosphodiesterase